jgi:hypothetical protein
VVIMVVVVTVLLLMMIIISLTRIGRRQPDHIYDRHDSADPRGPAWAARGSTVDEADPFVGAGASKLAGCPDWNEFADEALRRSSSATGYAPSQACTNCS